MGPAGPCRRTLRDDDHVAAGPGGGRQYAPRRQPAHQLLHNLKHNKVLHERVVFLTVKTLGAPRVPRRERVRVEQLRPDFLRMTVYYGFMQTPHVPRALATGRVHLIEPQAEPLSVTEFFRIPTYRVVELGTQIPTGLSGFA